MLTTIEKILFAMAVVVSLYFTYRGVMRIIGHISSGQGRPDWNLIWNRIDDLLVKVGLFQPVFRFRLGPSILHAFIGWGLYIFLTVDLSELIYGMTGFRLLNQGGIIGDIYRLMADIANAAILIGIFALTVRRFILRPRNLTTRLRNARSDFAPMGMSGMCAITSSPTARSTSKLSLPPSQ